ncbi:MAG: FAD-binding oxidoreductase [Pirellulales bacterium]|nr:FAD-binding oxidoreductase [Pirellulales bacterium]
MSSTQAPGADVLVIGGGVAGASTAMQLALRGQRVVVLERSLLGSGSTGRAAGLLGQLRSTRAATRMLVEGLEVVRDLEGRTGTQIFVQTGSLRIAADADRAAEIADHVHMGREAGLAIEHLTRERVAQLLPYMRTDDLLDACYCPTDGHLQPAELLAAYVRVAREHGVEFRTRSPVDEVYVTAGRVQGVRAAGQDYFAPIVINATGPWSYLTAAKAQTRLASAAIGHYYLTTQPQAEIPVDRYSPAVRDRANRIYTRPEVGGLIVGIYESEPQGYDMETLGDDFEMSELRAARTELRVALLLDAAGRRFPWINERTPMHITHGIMTFTPDGKPFCGPDAEIAGLFHCAAFCGHGIVQSPAIGQIMAQLVLDGTSRYDVSEIEADRYADFPELADRAAVKARCHAAYGSYYGAVARTDRQS